MVFAPDEPDSPDRARTSVDADAVETPHRAKAATDSRGPKMQPARCAAPPTGPTRSIGAATDGRLDHGCLLPAKGAGYVRRNSAGWATEETVALLQWATRAVATLYPRTAPVVIGALSKRNGGKLRGHGSHQSGRDIDIGYFASDNRRLSQFRPMHAGNLDVVKTWALLGALLSSGQVQYMFMDYELQVRFHRHLEREGVPQPTLDRIFQFPAGRTARRGIIRHASGHADHVHVRLRCPPHDRCR